MRQTQSLLALAAFVLAAVLCYIGAVWAVNGVEARSTELVHMRLSQAGLDWARVRADGLQLHLSGTAPTEAIRFRAISVASSEVDPGRIRDDMEVTPAKAIAAPRFSVELLRNEDGISLIGLVPTSTGHDPIVARVRPLAADGKVTDMLETSDYAAPEGWNPALEFGLAALKLLPRSKISIAADRVAVIAISSSPDAKRKLETDLARMAPKGVKVALDISAPRPVITPFTLRFLIDADGARFDACSADTDLARDRILTAAVAAGAKGKLACTVGLGVPSPTWADAAVEAIAAVKALGRASVTFSDADVTLLAADTVPQATYDRVIGDLGARLPEVFSLKATLAEKPKATKDKGPAEFTATLSPEGKVQLRGRLNDERLRDAVTSFARAEFGAESVYNAARLDPDLPDGWPVRVLAGLDALARLHHGALLVRADTVEVKGVTGSKDASDAISRVLSDRLGQGKAFSIAVHYDAAFDPRAGLPGPQECVDAVNTILTAKQVTFDPGSDRPDTASAKTLDALADALRPCTRVPMEVAGYTDNQGRTEMNLALSQARAEAVVKAILARRVPVENLSPKGYGEADPIADNATDAGREANRRIEFSLITDDSKAKAATTDAGATAAADTASESADGPLVAPDNLPEGEGGDSPLDTGAAAGDGKGGPTADGTTAGASPDTAAPATAPADATAPDAAASDAASGDGAADGATDQGTSTTRATAGTTDGATNAATDATDGEPYDSAAPTEITTRPKLRP